MKLSPKQRLDREKARRKILDAANKELAKSGQWTGAQFNSRQIQQAVFMCRQRRLVKIDVLVAAGYKP